MKNVIFIMNLLAIYSIFISFSAFAETRIVGDFAKGTLDSWQEKIFDEQTIYEMSQDMNATVLKATSQNSASGLYREISVDLQQMPYLNWTWKVENTLKNQQEQTKEGDDYPARIYVIFSGGFLFWQTRALNYVWSSHQPVETIWPNAYTENAQMIAIESGHRHTGVWRQQKRNVLEDYRRAFGVTPGKTDAVAIMTDTDNTGLKATSYYGKIYFSSE